MKTDEEQNHKNIINCNNEIKKLLKNGRVIELKTIRQTIYMEPKHLKSDENKEIQNSDLEFNNDKIVITKKDKKIYKWKSLS